MYSSARSLVSGAARGRLDVVESESGNLLQAVGFGHKRPSVAPRSRARKACRSWLCGGLPGR